MEFDGISEASAEKHLQLVKGMFDQGFSDRVLISQDAGWYHVGEPKGGKLSLLHFCLCEFHSLDAPGWHLNGTRPVRFSLTTPGRLSLCKLDGSPRPRHEHTVAAA